MSAIRLAVYCAAGCGGCDIALLETHEALLPFLEAAEIVFWPTVADFSYDDVRSMPDGSIDICIFNGAIRTEENAEIARLLRRKSRALVAFGACASLGGVPGLANLSDNEAMLRCVFLDTITTVNPGGVLPVGARISAEEVPLTPLREAVTPLDDVVAVDYSVPGCPPEAARVAEVLAAIAAGEVPAAPAVLGGGKRVVCDECELPRSESRPERFVRHHLAAPDGEGCLLERGVVCAGAATLSGCGAKCPAVGVPCRGCYGPAAGAGDMGAKLASVIGGLLASEDEAHVRAEVEALVDPTGTFYRFSLPASLLQRARADHAAAMSASAGEADEGPETLAEDGGQAA